MCSKQNRRFKFKPVQHDSRSKWIENISCECKCKFDGRKCNSDQWWNNDTCQCECKKHDVCEKDHILNPTCSCENGKYLASIMDDSAITCDEVRDAEKTNYSKKYNL